MSHPLNELLQTAQVTAPQQNSGLQVFGLRWQAAPRLVYSTLDEAMAAGTLEVMEVNAGGSVPELKVKSRSDVMTFLMAGEQLIGAKQNRVLNVSLMVGAHSELSVPVSCVETGRWSSRSAKFTSGGTSSHGLLRKMMSKQTGRSYRRTGTPSSDQSAVWGEVARKLGAMGSTSPTQEYDQIYRDFRTRLDDLLGHLTPPDGCHGVVFSVGDRSPGPTCSIGRRRWPSSGPSWCGPTRWMPWRPRTPKCRSRPRKRSGGFAPPPGPRSSSFARRGWARTSASRRPASLGLP